MKIRTKSFLLPFLMFSLCGCDRGNFGIKPDMPINDGSNVPASNNNSQQSDSGQTNDDGGSQDNQPQPYLTKEEFANQMSPFDKNLNYSVYFNWTNESSRQKMYEAEFQEDGSFHIMESFYYGETYYKSNLDETYSEIDYVSDRWCEVAIYNKENARGRDWFSGEFILPSSYDKLAFTEEDETYRGQIDVEGYDHSLYAEIKFSNKQLVDLHILYQPDGVDCMIRVENRGNVNIGFNSLNAYDALFMEDRIFQYVSGAIHTGDAYLVFTSPTTFELSIYLEEQSFISNGEYYGTYVFNKTEMTIQLTISNVSRPYFTAYIGRDRVNTSPITYSDYYVLWIEDYYYINFTCPIVEL